ncbi:MAG: ribose-phosphate diphosphokinase [Anaerolineae bacterium]
MPDVPHDLLYGRLILCSGTANVPLAQEIAAYLGTTLHPVEIRQFANSNTFVRLEKSVRGCDVFWVQPTSAPVNDNLMELLIAIDCLRRDSAGRITVVVPYYGYGRSDKKDQPRVPITARLVADMLTTAGADRVLTMDLHAGQIQGFFHIPVDDITARHHLADWVKGAGIENGVVLSPDLGHAKDARYFADEVDMPLALAEKRRSKDGGNTEALNLIGEVDGCDVLIVDEEIDTAGTMVHAAEFAKVARRAAGVRAGDARDLLAARRRAADGLAVRARRHEQLPPAAREAPGVRRGPVRRRPAGRGDPAHSHTGQSVGAMFNE